MLCSRLAARAVAAMAVAGLALIAVAAEDQVPLPLKLPRPGYTGTPPEDEYPEAEKMPDKPPAPPLVPKGVTQLALGKPTTSSALVLAGSLALVTDGDKESNEGTAVELKPRTQWVQIDLGAAHRLYYIDVWHFHREANIAHDVIVQVSNDATFASGVTTLFNNDKDNSSSLGAGTNKEYWESFQGKLISARQISARYVRLYTRGSTFSDPLNRYTEVEVWGI